MSKKSLFGAAAMAAALGFSAPALAQTEAMDEPSASAEAAAFSETDLEAYALASTEIAPLRAGLGQATPQEQQQTSDQILSILSEHDLDADTYNAISVRAHTDQRLATRIAELQVAQGDTGMEAQVASEADVEAELGANADVPDADVAVEAETGIEADAGAETGVLPETPELN